MADTSMMDVTGLMAGAGLGNPTDLRDAVSRTLVLDAMRDAANAFRSRALRACADVVKAAPPFHDEETATASLGDKVTPRMMAQILKIVRGESSSDSVVERDQAGIAHDLMSVTCIGQVAALRLAKAGVKGLDDLAARVDDPAIGLTAAQKLCVVYRRDIQQRIPRAEMAVHDGAIQEAAAASGTQAIVVGSYRRNAPTSGDIDVLLLGDLDAFLTPLYRSGYVVGSIAKGVSKFNGFVKLPGATFARRIDVLRTVPAELPFAMLHFTGPDVYNVALRKIAIAQGKRLSEKGWADDAAAPPASEADILRELGVQYQVPQDRCATLPMMPA